jgi:hypothetical protein
MHTSLIRSSTTKTKKPGAWPGPIFRFRKAYALKLEPQPQVDFTFGFSNLNPAASSVST